MKIKKRIMDNHNYNIQDLEEYIRQSEPARHERGEAWRVALPYQQGNQMESVRPLVAVR